MIGYNEYITQKTGKSLSTFIYCEFAPCRVRFDYSDGYFKSVSGEYLTNWGPLRLAEDGGTYGDNGIISYTSMIGNKLYGSWSQPPAMFSGACPGRQNHEGDFRFEFYSGGFKGAYSDCDEKVGSIDDAHQSPFSIVSWDGWRPMPIDVHNNCPFPLSAKIKWMDQDGISQDAGPFMLRENEMINPTIMLGSQDQDMYTSSFDVGFNVTKQNSVVPVTITDYSNNNLLNKDGYYSVRGQIYAGKVRFELICK